MPMVAMQKPRRPCDLFAIGATCLDCRMRPGYRKTTALLLLGLYARNKIESK